MRNLLLIGNGFDLAHGLNTKYSHFIKDIEKNPSKYGLQHINTAKNGLLKSLVELNKTRWSDIEYVYYDILINLKNSSYLKETYDSVYNYDTAEALNRDFEIIKEWLCKYLVQEELTNFKKVENYEVLFDCFNNQDTVVLNFNYTNTVKKYLAKCKNIELIHLHGELENEENPIIFGFAADNEESKRLLIENDNNFVRNIKKFNYLFTHNEEKLKEHLESPEYNVFILGHSCGISDKLILNQIFNTDGVYKIFPFYHEDRDGYFETMVNIDRIIDDYSKNKNEKVFDKLVSFPNSYKMPQKTKDNNLEKYLNNILSVMLPKEEQDIAAKKALASFNF